MARTVNDAVWNSEVFRPVRDFAAARAEARRLTEETIALLSGIPGSEFLCGLAEYLLEREN